jgi:hypothetical protein
MMIDPVDVLKIRPFLSSISSYHDIGVFVHIMKIMYRVFVEVFWS